MELIINLNDGLKAIYDFIVKLEILKCFQILYSDIRILVTTGMRQGNDRLATSCILSSKVQNSSFFCRKTDDYLFEVAGSFGINCDGTIIVGGGKNKSWENLSDVFEFTGKSFRSLNPLNFPRSWAAVAFIKNCVIVAGGDGKGKMIEYFPKIESFCSSCWQICEDELPEHLSLKSHQLSVLKDKLILTGGWDTNDIKSGNHLPHRSVFEGNVTFDEQMRLRIKWKRLAPMMHPRAGHMAVIINENLFCVGGPRAGGIASTTEYFEFDTGEWKSGPKLSCGLYKAQACYDDKLVIITGGLRDGLHSDVISTFDPINGLIPIEGKLDCNRSDHVAVML